MAELPLSALQNSAIFKNKGKIILTYEYEKLALNDGFKTVCGIDEAGRGPLAGPVFAAAVILPMDFEIEGLNDSKKLTQKKREQLFDIIVENAVSYSIATATEMEIDEINILKATFLAMNRAVDGLEVSSDIALIDGNQKPGLKIEERTMIKGDVKSVSIAAASILAKVSRDRYMIELSKIYPQYFFEKHKGYGTKLHYEMLEQHGISQVHRRTFLKKLLERE